MAGGEEEEGEGLGEGGIKVIIIVIIAAVAGGGVVGEDTTKEGAAVVGGGMGEDLIGVIEEGKGKVL